MACDRLCSSGVGDLACGKGVLVPGVVLDLAWKTSTPEHLGLCIRFLGMNLEHVNNDRSQELDLTVGTTPAN